MSRISDTFNPRASAGYVFLSGNATLLLANYDGLNFQKTAIAALLLTASALYTFTRKRPALFGPAGGCVISAQAAIAATAEGTGQHIQMAGTILPSIQGALMIRKAYNSVRGETFTTHYSALKVLEWIDKRPVLAGALIEGPGVAAIAIGAGLSHDWALCAAASQWTIANVFLGLSDTNRNDPSNYSTKFDLT